MIGTFAALAGGAAVVGAQAVYAGRRFRRGPALARLLLLVIAVLVVAGDRLADPDLPWPASYLEGFLGGFVKAWYAIAALGGGFAVGWAAQQLAQI